MENEEIALARLWLNTLSLLDTRVGSVVQTVNFKLNQSSLVCHNLSKLSI